MSLDTLLDEDQRRRLEQQQGTASAGQMDQMAGSGLLEDDETTPPDAPPAPSGAETAPPPAPEAETAPQGSQTPAQDLLKQVQGGQISRPALDKAFGPPPTPQNEPGAQVFAPKMADAPGIDWKGLSDRLAAARQRDSASKQSDNWLTNIASVLNPRAHVDSGSNETAGVEDELKLAQAKQKMADEQAQAAGRGAKATTDAAELDRRRKADQLKEDMERAGLTSKYQFEGDREKEAIRKRQNDEAEKQAARSRQDDLDKQKAAMDAANIEHTKAETAKLNRVPTGPGAKATAAAEKAKKGEENVTTAADEIMNGQMTTDDLKGRDAEFRKAVTTELYKRDPKFSLHKAQLFNNQISEYYDAKPGSAGATLQATKTARDHLQLMKEQAAKLDNSDSRTLNTIKQKFANELGFNTVAEALGAFKTGQITTGSELATAYNHATEGGHKAYEMILDPTTPPKVAAAQFDMITKQMDERMSERELPLRALAQTPGHHKMIDELFPKASASGAAKEGDESKLSSGVPIIYRGGKWVKK